MSLTALNLLLYLIIGEPKTLFYIYFATRDRNTLNLKVSSYVSKSLQLLCYAGNSGPNINQGPFETPCSTKCQVKLAFILFGAITKLFSQLFTN